MATVAPASHRWRFDPWLIVLVALPWLLIAVNPNWFYAKLGAIDTWVYFGFFHNLPLYASQWFPQTYYGSRLSWILPGYVLHRLVPDVVAAHYILHISLYYAAIFSFYSILRQAVGSRSAVLGSVLFGCHAAFLTTVGWNYIDAPGLVYNLAGLALAVKAGRARQPYGWLFLAGVAGAAMLYCNLFFVLLLPFMPAFYVYLRLGNRSRRLLFESWAASIWMGAGGLCLTVLLALVNHRLDRYFHFLRPTLRYAAQSGSFHHPGLAQLAGAYFLALPAIAAAGALVWLILGLVRHRFRRGEAGCLLALNAVATAGVMLAVQILRGYALEVDTAATSLLPSAFLGLGVVLAMPDDRWKRARHGALVLGAIAIFAAPLLIPGKTGGGSPLELLAITASGALGVLWKCFSRSIVAVAIALLALAVPHYRTTTWMVDRPGRADNADALRRVRDGVDAVVARSGSSPAWFWYNRAEKHGPEMHAINGCFLWLWTMIGNDFPATRPDLAPQAGWLVVLLTSELSREEMLREANQALEQKGLRVRLVDHVRIDRRGVAYDMHFVRLERLT